MEITKSSACVFYAAKVLTLAPFDVRLRHNGAFEINRSRTFTVYSAAVMAVLVILTYHGLLFDATSSTPVRMKSATSKVVTAFDVSVVVFAALAGTLCGLGHLLDIREFNARLQKFDDCLHSYGNIKMDRLRSNLMLLPLLLIALLLGYDICTWLRYAALVGAEVNIYWYMPFYTQYLILTGLHCAFANTVYGLGYRYRRLNAMLRNSFLLKKAASAKCDQRFQHKIASVHTISWNDSSPTTTTITKAKKKSTKAAGEEFAGQLPSFQVHATCSVLRSVGVNHASLSKCVTVVSDAYGCAVMFILISCFLHLVATAYFLFLGLLELKDNGYVSLQILWILFHALRLLMVVEPCHMTAMESKRTIHIVCEVERGITDPVVIEEIKKLWQQLIVVNGKFSAFGLCYVNRSILTSIGSAIATYLVILIQFERTNG